MKNFLGMDVADAKVAEILTGLDCRVEAQAVTPPSYRLDLTRAEDLAEEVARTLGYDAIPETLPPVVGGANFGASARAAQTLIDRAKESFVAQGFWESVTFAFSSRQWLEKLRVPFASEAPESTQ